MIIHLDKIMLTTDNFFIIIIIYIASSGRFLADFDSALEEYQIHVKV